MTTLFINNDLLRIIVEEAVMAFGLEQSPDRRIDEGLSVVPLQESVAGLIRACDWVFVV